MKNSLENPLYYCKCVETRIQASQLHKFFFDLVFVFCSVPFIFHLLSSCIFIFILQSSSNYECLCSEQRAYCSLIIAYMTFSCHITSTVDFVSRFELLSSLLNPQHRLGSSSCPYPCLPYILYWPFCRQLGTPLSDSLKCPTCLSGLVETNKI